MINRKFPVEMQKSLLSHRELTIKHALVWASTLLKETCDNAHLEAELLLAQIIAKSRVFLYTHPEYTLNLQQTEQYQQIINKRASGMPYAYLTGIREFWSLPLCVSTDTLIPRPETELLVELTLQFVNDPAAHLLDLGTGSGAIALALASEKPQWHLLACDKSQAALNIASKNAHHLNLNNIQFLHSDWFQSLPQQQFNAIISNPPYIAESDCHLSQGDLRFEPRDALVSGVNGLDALIHIITNSYERLAPNGWLLLEHGYTQGQAVTDKLKQFGYQDIQCWQDWQGHDRVSGGRKI